MRHQAILAAIVLMAAGSFAPAIGWAQGNPSSSQILKSLTPTTTTGTTRGIRVGPSSGGSAAQPKATTAPSVSLTVQFATGSADLTPQAVQVLNNLGKAMSDQSLAPYHFRVEGHTDTVGTRELNKTLSERRADAVADYLATNFHIDRARLQPVGMGEDNLLVPTPDQTNEPRNRRVQVVNIGS